MSVYWLENLMHTAQCFGGTRSSKEIDKKELIVEIDRLKMCDEKVVEQMAVNENAMQNVQFVYIVQSYSPVVKNALQQLQGNIGLPCGCYREIIEFPGIYTCIGA